jgi:hypothetical protein
MDDEKSKQVVSTLKNVHISSTSDKLNDWEGRRDRDRQIEWTWITLGIDVQKLCRKRNLEKSINQENQNNKL